MTGVYCYMTGVYSYMTGVRLSDNVPGLFLGRDFDGLIEFVLIWIVHIE